jgi:hypothetical protein
VFSPSTTYHAELRAELDSLGRALAVQRGLLWAMRGLVFGMLVDLGLLGWAWTRDVVPTVPAAVFVAAPMACTLLAGIASALLARQGSTDLARRVDRAVGLQERSITALELGATGADHPLAVAQMRDAVEHLKRLDPLETFPLRAPKHELIAAAVTTVLALAIALMPNPWAGHSRPTNPAVATAREQAQRVERLADSLPEGNAELDQLRELLRKGARTIDTRSGEPDTALAAMEDLEDQLRQLGAGDDQLAAALASIASVLAGDPDTSELAAAINSGDLREVSRAARDLGARTEQMDGQERQRVASVLRDAANRAGRASPSAAGQLGEAANALGGGSEAQGGAAEQGGSQERSGTPHGEAGSGDRSAREALGDLGNHAAAAAERQRIQSQLEGSRNALEGALGRGQSRSANSSGRSGSGNQHGGSGNRTAGGDDRGDGSQGQPGSPGQSSGGGSTAGGQGADGRPGESGYGTGTQNRKDSGGARTDTATRLEQLHSDRTVAPDESASNPYLGEAGQSTARAGEEQVSPTFSKRSTQGGDGGSIPLGLRDLVKDYFSSLDKK